MRKRISELPRAARLAGGGAVIVLVVLAGLFAVRSRGATSTFQTEVVQRGDLTATVGATGTVLARRSALLKWQTTGTVAVVNAEVGDHVRESLVLASLDPRSVPQAVILAEGELVEAQRALDDLINSDTARAQAEIALKSAEDAYEKAFNYRLSLNSKGWFKKVVVRYVNHQPVSEIKWYRGLADAETIARADDELALKAALLEDAQRTFDRIENGPNQADVEAAEARVAAAQATLDTATIIAPFSGTVTQAFPEIGTQVQLGEAAFRMDDLDHLLVDVQVSEIDINSVALGQEAEISFDAILDRDYRGTVVEVGAAGDTIEGVVTFTVTVALSDADELVRPGMTAAVNIVVSELHDVLLIPNRAVRLLDGQRVIYVLREERPVPVPIELGQSSGEKSVVVEGELAVGDMVVLNPPVMFGGPFGG